jgi:hypothetical protein
MVEIFTRNSGIILLSCCVLHKAEIQVYLPSSFIS